VNWTGEPEESPSEASPRKLWKRSGWIQTIFGFLLEPLLPKEESRKPLVPEVEQPEPLPKAELEPLAEKYRGGVLKKAIYTPHGKWAWAAGLPFTESGPALLLSCKHFVAYQHLHVTEAKVSGYNVFGFPEDRSHSRSASSACFQNVRLQRLFVFVLTLLLASQLADEREMARLLL
jgi:hypothetical protein